MDVTADLWAVAISLLTGVSGWVLSKLKTQRERRKSDLDLINEAVSPLLKSIKDLTEHNSRILNDRIEQEQQLIRITEENSNLKKERGELLKKIDSLERKVSTLTAKVNKLLKYDEQSIDNVV